MTPAKNPTGKQRSQRIQIDYYKQRTGLDRWRTGCVFAGLLAAGVYATYLLVTVSASGGGRHLSTGDLAMAHASFEQECQKCHVDYTPLDPAAPTAMLPLIGGDEAASRIHLERACQACHEMGPHHRDVMTASFAEIDQNCVNCHRDHQGRDFDLTAITQATCSQCHADLGQVTSDQPTIQAVVTGFDKTTHGDFASLALGDPGQIRFSHHQHMLPGQVAADSVGGFTIGQLSASDRLRYERDGQNDNSPVQLDCSSCHELVGEDVLHDKSGGESKSRTSLDFELLGRTMRPIEFERHCGACHAISSAVAAVGISGGNASETAVAVPLPHAVEWSRLSNLIVATLNGARAGGSVRHRRDDTQKRPQVGPGLGRPAREDWRVTDEELAAAMSRVKDQCMKCHDSESMTDEAILAASQPGRRPMIPRRWLQHGMYDHAAHRKIDCRYCHADAFPPDSASGELVMGIEAHANVMIAGIESCQDCHREAGTPTPTAIENEPLLGGMPTWASDSCSMCHRYHGALMKQTVVTGSAAAGSESMNSIESLLGVLR